MSSTDEHSLDGLPLHAFDLDAEGIRIETLTTGHALTELGASWCTACCSC